MDNITEIDLKWTFRHVYEYIQHVENYNVYGYVNPFKEKSYVRFRILNDRRTIEICKKSNQRPKFKSLSYEPVMAIEFDMYCDSVKITNYNEGGIKDPSATITVGIDDALYDENSYKTIINYEPAIVAIIRALSYDNEKK